MKFHCSNCKITFDNDQGLKKEYKDYILGDCWKYIAYCPQCQAECSEKRDPHPGKGKNNPPFDCGFSGCKNQSCRS
jgi:hypothetical protein